MALPQLLFKAVLMVFAVTFVVLGYLGTQPATALFSEIGFRFGQLYFLFFLVLWVVQQGTLGEVLMRTFVILLFLFLVFDGIRFDPSKAGLMVMSGVLAAAYLGVFLLGPITTSLNESAPVPERVTVMRKTIALLLCMLPITGSAAGAAVPLESANVDLSDVASLQRGARTFVNHCLSCHSAKFMRYNRMGADLGISDELIEENMLFASDNVVDTMQVAMRGGDAEAWLGAAPPDLSVVARSRGADWIYSYLLSFYEDTSPTRPHGVDNLVFVGTAMPHVLAELQGVQVRKEDVRRGGRWREDAHGGHPVHIDELLELQTPGTLNPAQYRKTIRDLVNFLVYMGEPAQLVRYKVGLWVLLVLGLLIVLSRGMYKQFWRDIH